MPWKESEDVSEGQVPSIEQLLQAMEDRLKESAKKNNEELRDRLQALELKMERSLARNTGPQQEISDETRTLEQHAASLEHGARQPRLAMEADGPANMKTRERTEGAATAVQAMRGDSFSASWVEPGPKTNPTSFGMEAEPPDLPFIEDVVVECGCRTQVVSTIFGDAPINSRWWLSSHRRNLHNNGDQL